IGCWTAGQGNFGPAGIYYPTTAQYYYSSAYNGSLSLVPDGNRAAFDLQNGIVQSVSAILQAGGIYDFSAWVGAPLTLFDSSGTPNSAASFDIRIADGTGGPILLDIPGTTGNALDPFGYWRQVSKSFVVPTQGPSGAPLIALSGGSISSE